MSRICQVMIKLSNDLKMNANLFTSLLKLLFACIDLVDISMFIMFINPRFRSPSADTCSDFAIRSGMSYVF